MNMIGIFIGVCILGIGIFYSQNNPVGSTVDKDPSEQTTPTTGVLVTPDTAEETPTNTMYPSNTVSPTNSIPTKTNSFSFSEFTYPSARVIATSENRIELSSDDSASAITDWYKSKITSVGMSAKSFVMTSTNGVVVNKLAAAGGGREITVDITTSSLSSDVQIIVELN